MKGAHIYHGKDPATVPAYTIAEAAALVGVPTSTLRDWTFGRQYPRRNGRGRSEAILRTPDRGRFLSFTNVVEAHVLSGLRTQHHVRLDSIRRAVAYVEKNLGKEHPLAREKFKTDGIDLFVEGLGREIINASRGGQSVIRAVLGQYLERVEYVGGSAVRFFPLHRAGAPRVVVVDPHRAFGRPILEGTSVPVEDLRARWNLGEPISELARDFEVSAEAIEEALRGTAPKAA